MSKWVCVGAKITEEEKAVLENYLNDYNTIKGTTFSLSGFIRFLLNKNAEIFNKNHSNRNGG